MAELNGADDDQRRVVALRGTPQAAGPRDAAAVLVPEPVHRSVAR